MAKWWLTLLLFAFPLALVLRVGNQRTVLQISEDSVRP